MTVFPGFGGQAFMAEVLGKVRQVRDAVDAGSFALDIEVDGGIDVDTAPRRRKPAPTCSSPGVPSSGTSVRGRRPTASGGRSKRAGPDGPPSGQAGARRRRGILGTWHAFELCRAGYSVHHLEADVAPQGASLRNFGLLWVSGRRTGAELDAARRSRTRWEELGTAIAGIGFRPTGSLTVARTDAERTVMEEFAHHPDAGQRSIDFVDAEGVVALNPAVRGEVAGGLHCAQDAVVEPRLMLGAMRDYLTGGAI